MPSSMATTNRVTPLRRSIFARSSSAPRSPPCRSPIPPAHPGLLVSDRYRNETPQQLIPVLVHESMHDGIDNSFEEEIIASLLDSLTYAEVLSIDPDAANTGTELAAYNNVQLFALMNSIGRRGAGYVGVETSLDGDVYVGPGLETFDADSIRAGIASDPWYAQLPRGGSHGRRGAGGAAGTFSGERGVGRRPIAFRRKRCCHRSGYRPRPDPTKSARAGDRPAASLTTGDGDPIEPGDLQPSIDLLPSPSFLPADPSLFDLRSMRPTARAAGHRIRARGPAGIALRAGRTTTVISAAMARVRRPAPSQLVARSRPSSRVCSCCPAIQRWAPILASALEASNDSGAPVRIAFRDLPFAVPAIWESAGWGGSPVVWINSMLHRGTARAAGNRHRGRAAARIGRPVRRSGASSPRPSPRFSGPISLPAIHR